jgi:hypothetical protein
MKAMTKNEIWSALQQAALVEGAMPIEGEKHTPWFVRVMLGVAGWIGALFLVGFVAATMTYNFKEAGVFWVIGAIACGSAGVLFRANRHGDFASQFGLAVAIAGQLLMTYGVAEGMKASFTAISFVIALQQGLLFALMPNFVHRVWAAATATMALCFAMSKVEWYVLALPLVTAGLVVVLLQEFQHARQGELLRAGGYGLALAAMFLSYMNVGGWNAWYGRNGQPADPVTALGLVYAGRALTALVMVGAAVLLLRREKVAAGSGAGKVALTLAIVLALASVKAPGLAPATAILLLGFANGNRVLTGLGIVALLAYLSHYYYMLDATLLEKSVIMVVTGIALLGLRVASNRWWQALQEEPNHA